MDNKIPNETVSFSKSDVVKIIQDLSTIVVSLDRIGSTCDEFGCAEYERMLIDFVENWRVSARLARARSVLSEPFSTELGPDDMDELERATQNIPYWSINNRVCPD